MARHLLDLLHGRYDITRSPLAPQYVFHLRGQRP